MIRIVAPHFVAGIEFTLTGIAVHSAPIIQWMLGKKLSWVTRYCERREWEWEFV